MLAALAFGAALAGLVSGCSSSSGFPGVLDKPVPRADIPLSPDQVQQATSDLITDRDRLSSEAQGSQAGAAPSTTGAVQASVKTKPAPAVGQPISLDATQTAGADAKP
jgi:hypothetical protein